jgi:hypothetical protein
MVAQVGRIMTIHWCCQMTQHLHICYRMIKCLSEPECLIMSTYEETVSNEYVEREEDIASGFEPRCEVRKSLDKLIAICALVLVDCTRVEEPL